MKVQPVIMSGGAGTRLWPLSRRARPKQFLNLASDQSLFQETVLRSTGEGFAPPMIIAGNGHGALVREQLDEIGVTPADIILEPAPRNTAAVAGVASAWAAANNSAALVFLSPADHHIGDPAGFRQAIHDGCNAADEDRIVTFGIKPTHPHTGYGYIQCGDGISGNVFTVSAFKEKPDATLAKTYCDDGGYFWNAGIFLFRPQVMLSELEKHEPEIAAAAIGALNASVADKQNGACCRLLDKTAFETAPSTSIDYAVMERTDKAAIVAPVDVGWNDVGGWNEVTGDPQSAGHVTTDCQNLTIRADGPTVSALGVEDLIIVATDDAVLVARRDRAQDVKMLVEELKRRGREDLL